MELFLIYDILHTKAAVIHTWRYAYHVVDSAITYALLIGAILLEITTLLGTVGLWLDSIGQYNLFDFYTCDMTDLRGRIAMKHNPSISRDIKELLPNEIPKRGLGDIKSARGMCILHGNGIYDKLSWSMEDIDFEKSILVWHVATDIYLYCCKEEVEYSKPLVAKAIKEISNYMLYFLVQHPNMLPGRIRCCRYPEVCASLVKLWQEQYTSSLEGQDNNRSKSEKLASLLLKKFGSESTKVDKHGQVYHLGAALAGCLLRNEWNVPDMLGLTARVWFEMLCYAAHHCSKESHARQLSTGGEFLTMCGFSWSISEISSFRMMRDLVMYQPRYLNSS
uniref:DUF4220 domain-containing protein n=1 Tax=Oryza barthii TaxID=65489 RepID=A0A0D3HU96_9ORYZ